MLPVAAQPGGEADAGRFAQPVTPPQHLQRLLRGAVGGEHLLACAPSGLDLFERRNEPNVDISGFALRPPLRERVGQL